LLFNSLSVHLSQRSSWHWLMPLDLVRETFPDGPLPGQRCGLSDRLHKMLWSCRHLFGKWKWFHPLIAPLEPCRQRQYQATDPPHCKMQGFNGSPVIILLCRKTNQKTAKSLASNFLAVLRSSLQLTTRKLKIWMMSGPFVISPRKMLPESKRLKTTAASLRNDDPSPQAIRAVRRS